MNHFLIFFILHSSLLIAMLGCASVPRNPRAPSPQPFPPELAAYYDYPRVPRQVTSRLLRERFRYRETLVQFPLAAEGFTPTEPTVEFEWFESKESGRRPAILFNPILGGDYPLERGMCRFFASHGFHVALVHRRTLKVSPEKPVDHLELLLRQAVLRIRQIVDWMEAHERVDPKRMGSFGLSMGGIATVMTAAVEPRLRVHVVALAGGPIADIVTASHDKLLTKPLAKYLAQRHLDRAAFEHQLRAAVRTDPILLAPYVDSRRMLMVIALADRTIGVENALRLWRALGRPQASFIPLGHYTSYLALPYLEYISLRFFKQHLETLE